MLMPVCVEFPFLLILSSAGLISLQTRLLVTHSVTFLPKVDVIVVLKDGRISEVGAYQDLIEQDGDFADFLKTHLTEMDDESSDERNDVILIWPENSANPSEPVCHACASNVVHPELIELQRKLSNVKPGKVVTSLSGTESEVELSVKRRQRWHKWMSANLAISCKIDFVNLLVPPPPQKK